MNKITEQEKQLLERYEIEFTQKTLYLYKQYRYENLNDALRYAEIDSQRDRRNIPLHGKPDRKHKT